MSNNVRTLSGPARIPRTRWLVMIPARNEAESIGRVIRDVKARGDCDVVVIDDCSEDRTRIVAREKGVEVLRLPFWLGAWGAVQTGLRYALEAGYTLAVSVDADGQHRAASLDAVTAPVLAGDSDVVIGVCPVRASMSRRFVWAVFRRITGLATLDITSGLRAYNSTAMKLLVSDRAAILNYQDVGVLLMLRAQGFRVKEVPVQMRPRQNGHSRVYYNWAAVVTYVIETFMLTAGKWRPSWHLQRNNAAKKSL